VLEQFGSKCVAFDIPTQDVEMIVILDWKTLESALVYMSLARRMIMRMISHRVRQCCPA